MASLCNCRPGANTIIAAQASWKSLPKTVAFQPSRRFMSTQKYASTSRQTRCQVLRSPAASLPPQTRPYHSSLHAPLPTHEYTNSQTAILSAALEHISEHGFTKDALILGARDVGFLDVSIQLFSRQEMDLVLYWLASRRGLLRAKVQNGLFEGQQKSVDEKIKTLVLERLRMNSEIIHHWQNALALMSFPSNIPISLSELHALSSDILYLAGDASVDSSWYTRRLSLSTTYVSAEMIMTKDSTPDFTHTEDFVERRIRDNATIGGKLGDVKSYFGFMAGTAVGLGRSWGLKI
ncbi:hypothetical protein UA08_00639 [Talaromyces atroroseus]|uniref:Ubiquinone biosynthesis protein n=1 Tax=Talaromyces atroroseus TaxID=1441469 RepID=A0A225B776_TALAT|nr:hypothetical protein UA08_00639 [Talaromyces atroroseus]OKL63979.1 hypothetical protein UA08_00639 [Talaromyces atroroseus]